MHRILLFFVILSAFCAGLQSRQNAAQHSICRFSLAFTQNEIRHNSTDFEANMFYWDGQFHTDGVGYRTTNGMTIGHTALGYATGLLNSIPQDFAFSTPSNEAYHIMLLTLAINGSSQASSFVYSANPIDAPQIAASILASKLTTYLAFNSSFPGYGGFLPTFESNSIKIKAVDGWRGKLSAAENGQLMWAIYSLVHTLARSERAEFKQLGNSWAQWLLHARENAKKIFVRSGGGGDVCAVSTLAPELPPMSPMQRYFCEDESCLNNNPFEGELMSWFLYFSKFLNQTETAQLWDRKRPQLIASNYTGSTVDTSRNQKGVINYSGHEIFGRHVTPITVQKGRYFGSNEQIKLLFMPYLDIPVVGRVFKNAERVRTCNSVLMGNTPGMFASTPNSTFATDTTTEFDHINNAGIPSVAVFEQQELDMITPYSVFPTILFDKGIGLSWYKNMLDGRQMQTVYGSAAATRRDGSAVARFVSWETKAPTLLSLLNGIVDIVRDGMKLDNIYEEFYRVTEREYCNVFEAGPMANPIMGETVELCLPNAKVPTSGLIDFSSCSFLPE